MTESKNELTPPSSARKIAAFHAGRKQQEIIYKKTRVIDELTGLFTRDEFKKRLLIEATRADRKGEPITVMVMDANGLKEINDSLGHKAGDEHLKKIGNAIGDSIRRKTDLARRLGGDEFAILLPDTSIEGAVTYWEKVLNPSMVTAEIHMSFGLASVDSEKPFAAIDAADLAMYEVKSISKEQRRNLLKVHGGKLHG